MKKNQQQRNMLKEVITILRLGPKNALTMILKNWAQSTMVGFPYLGTWMWSGFLLAGFFPLKIGDGVLEG
jgi:hypothetical protein